MPSIRPVSVVFVFLILLLLVFQSSLWMTQHFYAPLKSPPRELNTDIATMGASVVEAFSTSLVKCAGDSSSIQDIAKDLLDDTDFNVANKWNKLQRLQYSQLLEKLLDQNNPGALQLQDLMNQKQMYKKIWGLIQPYFALDYGKVLR